jgi:predicted transcriptional regulator
MNVLFGSRRRTQVLLLLALLEESHSREISRVLDMSLFSVQRIVSALEEEGVLVSRIVGRERRISFNRRYPAYAELIALLLKLAVRDPEVDEAASQFRTRPRAKGKEI